MRNTSWNSENGRFDGCLVLVGQEIELEDGGGCGERDEGDSEKECHVRIGLSNIFHETQEKYDGKIENEEIKT